ncbi:recombination regulator RecX [Leifsonia poae]|uniref:Regulatory protein RecX n=1 Tax=Leifsonia poae TaxID=110933 RepID=A0A9W6LZ17_9MICO|nr:hypothetical protein GCM10017584_13520 [Leifsonia poae]
MVSFPPSDDKHEGGADGTASGERLAPVTNLRDARRSGASHGGAEAAASASGHPSARRTSRPPVAFPRADEESGPSAESGDSEAPAAGERSGKRTSGVWSRSFLDESPDEAAGDDGVQPGARAGDSRSGSRASNVSMHQLARRGMSRWELSQVLAKREIEPEIAEAELNRLESVGLLDDAALAVTLVYTQHNRKGLGRTAIAQELKRRHIAPDIIDDALAEIEDEDELERATELAVKRIGQLSSYDDETAKRRLNGFLARKGYSSSIVRQAMDVAFASRRSRGVRFQ